MKTRDYVFWTVLTLATLLVGHQLRLVEGTRSDAPQPPATFLSRATYWLAMWRLAQAAPTPVPFQHVQELPESVVNAPPMRLSGEDGEPLLDHSAGW